MPRFFVDSSQLSGGRVTIFGDDAHHISRALRMAPGERITVCDPDGVEHLCELDSFSSDEVGGIVIESHASKNELPSYITLYQAYPKGEKADYIVQKAVELGASEIVFFESSRCISRIIGDKQEKKLERYSRIALEAAKQCGRAVIPKIQAPLRYGEALKRAACADLPLFCYEGQGTSSLKCVLPEKAPATVSVVVGSEGGFSSDEAQLARECGLCAVGLGNRILRAETASGFVLSCLCCTYESK
jgi:16S rRNA (uracil1498-N3)-methyltransferase